MKLAKLTASTAALLLSSTALLAQEAQSQAFQSVFIDVGGTAVLVPLDVALEACGLDESTLQTAFQGRLDDSGIDQTQFTAQMDSAMGTMNQGATGDAAAQDTAAAGDASGTMTTEGGTASADAGGAAGAAGSTDDATGMASDTTQTADANATTDAGNATTDLGNTTATADASGAAAGDASATGAAAGTGTTDMATADASGAAGQDATATGDVQNVETTAADTTAGAGGANADPFLLLAACQIDQARATELQVDLTRTGQSLGFDANALGFQSGTANQ